MWHGELLLMLFSTQPNPLGPSPAPQLEMEMNVEQLILHLIGDYLTQSDWMADNKTKRFLPAAIHATFYSAPFWVLRFWSIKPSLAAWLVIFVTHFLIDRYRLARYVAWAKNWISPVRPDPISECPTGYGPTKPIWLAVWLLIVADNTLHLAINYAALRWL